MNKFYTTAEIADSIDVTVMTVTRRAKRESWASRARSGKGGGKEYAFDSLPESVKTAILRHEATNTCNVSSIPTTGPSLADLNDNKRTKALAKADLLQLYTDWLSQAKRGSKAEARTDFILAYKGGAWPRLLETLGSKISWQTIERWKVQLRNNKTVVVLADQRGEQNRQRSVMTDEHMDILLRAVLSPNNPTISSAMRTATAIMQASGITDVPCDKTMRRKLESWKETNFGDWVYTREGKKAWNDKAAFFIERDYSLIEVGDIMIADGHVLNFETLNPWTGKGQRMELVMWYDMASNCPLGWEIMPTEDTQSIAASFRRACLTLGMFPKIAYLDNGRAFRSQYFNGVDFRQTGVGGLFKELGINTIFAWPYHGQSKTIERFFGTLHDLEQWVPSYVGNCIDAKPPRLNRGEAMHRKAYEAVGGRPLTMEETHVAVARWIDEYINRPQRGHLKGKCPAELMLAGRGPGIDERELRHLMMVKKVRKITREGIRLFGERYYAPELYSRTHEVQVRYDMHDLSQIMVYRDGEYLCTASKTAKIHPAANLLGDETHQNEFKKAVTFRKQQEKDAASYTKTVLESAMYDQAQRMKELEVKKETSNTVTEIKPLTQAKVTSIEAVKAKALEAQKNAPAYTPPAEKSDILSEQDKYEYLFTISYQKGITLREPDQEWMGYYETTDEYQYIAARCEQRKKFYARKQATN
ncbi:Mu transposase C-terminal domain-containing protein [Desulfovibrio gilichinskyi]|uniref:Putative transposase n=1 Tax=Desulfovibrio gilichinskyi TaxID=1519643 RepID=A0A1X7F2V4_9BACT|nr:Mu transposase C-terminal domain-containing protein [Desulfovibrio gilichinskyi]SMF44483.1 putative transposase [Desulfovibrio gilichinskyi]